MFSRLPHRALYASFDRYPCAKGASTHIGHFAQQLFSDFGGGILYALGDAELPAYQREPGPTGPIELVRFCESLPNFLDRALAFGEQLTALAHAHVSSLELVHFREPFSGQALLAVPGRRYAMVYEINGLPSIELPALYPSLLPQTLEKLRAAERRCFTEADVVVTPSHTLAENLRQLGVPATKLQVIANGAELPALVPARPPEASPSYLLYFGALQPWQGVDVLLRAMQRLLDLPLLQLVICSSSHQRYARPYLKLAERLGVADRLRIFYQLSQEQLLPWLCHATATVAPLTECARNLNQGCCPLKILESMAAGVPVVASDLPVVRELIPNDSYGVLVRPDRPAELARALRLLLESPDELPRLAARAQQRIAEGFTWEHSRKQLQRVYKQLRAQPRFLTEAKS